MTEGWLSNKQVSPDIICQAENKDLPPVVENIWDLRWQVAALVNIDITRKASDGGG
jgi:hypothetical protein